MSRKRRRPRSAVLEVGSPAGTVSKESSSSPRIAPHGQLGMTVVIVVGSDRATDWAPVAMSVVHAARDVVMHFLDHHLVLVVVCQVLAHLR